MAYTVNFLWESNHQLIDRLQKARSLKENRKVKRYEVVDDLLQRASTHKQTLSELADYEKRLQGSK